jgi:hypothetical protein
MPAVMFLLKYQKEAEIKFHPLKVGALFIVIIKRYVLIFSEIGLMGLVLLLTWGH